MNGTAEAVPLRNHALNWFERHHAFSRFDGNLAGKRRKQTDLAAYLRRLNYSGPATPSRDVLFAIHQAHHRAVPFENLDIWLQRRIVLDESAFYRKIVGERRGGFCYELNGLFAAMLRQMGFTVTLLSGRVPRKEGGVTPEFDHMVLRVDLDQPYLADVGFGEAFQQPIMLRDGAEEEQDGVRYRLFAEGGRWIAERRNSGGEWNQLYEFSLQPRELQDFAGMCHFHQTSPHSNFTQRRICSLATEDGRVTLADMRLIVTRNGQREERILASEEEYRRELVRSFGIVLPGGR